MASTKGSAAFDIEALTETEQRRLYDNLAYKFSGTKTIEFTQDETNFYTSMMTAIRACGGYSSLPLSSLVGTKGVGLTRYRDHVTALNDYITHGCAVKLDRGRRTAIQVKLLTCLIRYMIARRIPAGPSPNVSPVVIIRCMGMLPTAVEMMFPGYVSAGFLHFVSPLNHAKDRLV